MQAVVGATLVGAIGSAAYLTALLLGFLGDIALLQMRPRFELLSGKPLTKRLSMGRIALFVLFGGAIAAVFQMGQGDVFAPIQALVLGATWPTVISQIMAKSGETEGQRILDFAERISGREDR